MDTAKFSQGMHDVIGFSLEEAQRLGSETIAPEHLLLGILRERDSKAILQLSKLNINLQHIKRSIESRTIRKDAPNLSPDIPLDKTAERVLKMVLLEVKSLEYRGSTCLEIDTEHLSVSYTHLRAHETR